jgi:hypothetical protein
MNAIQHDPCWIHPVSDTSSDSESYLSAGTYHRLRGFLDDDGLSDADIGEREAENKQERLYREEEERIMLTEARLDPDWGPKRRRNKHKAATGEGRKGGKSSSFPRRAITDQKSSQSQV